MAKTKHHIDYRELKEKILPLISTNEKSKTEIQSEISTTLEGIDKKTIKQLINKAYTDFKTTKDGPDKEFLEQFHSYFKAYKSEKNPSVVKNVVQQIISQADIDVAIEKALVETGVYTYKTGRVMTQEDADSIQKIDEYAEKKGYEIVVTTEDDCATYTIKKTQKPKKIVDEQTSWTQKIKEIEDALYMSGFYKGSISHTPTQEEKNAAQNIEKYFVDKGFEMIRCNNYYKIKKEEPVKSSITETGKAGLSQWIISSSYDIAKKIEFLEKLNLDKELIERDKISLAILMNREVNKGIPQGEIGSINKITIPIDMTKYPDLLQEYKKLAKDKSAGREELFKKLDNELAERLILDNDKYIQYKGDQAGQTAHDSFASLKDLEGYKDKIDLITKKESVVSKYFIIKRPQTGGEEKIVEVSVVETGNPLSHEGQHVAPEEAEEKDTDFTPGAMEGFIPPEEVKETSVETQHVASDEEVKELTPYQKIKNNIRPLVASVDQKKIKEGLENILDGLSREQLIDIVNQSRYEYNKTRDSKDKAFRSRITEYMTTHEPKEESSQEMKKKPTSETSKATETQSANEEKDNDLIDFIRNKENSQEDEDPIYKQESSTKEAIFEVLNNIADVSKKITDFFKDPLGGTKDMPEMKFKLWNKKSKQEKPAISTPEPPVENTGKKKNKLIEKFFKWNKNKSAAKKTEDEQPEKIEAPKNSHQILQTEGELNNNESVSEERVFVGDMQYVTPEEVDTKPEEEKRLEELEESMNAGRYDFLKVSTIPNAPKKLFVVEGGLGLNYIRLADEIINMNETDDQDELQRREEILGHILFMKHGNKNIFESANEEPSQTDKQRTGKIKIFNNPFLARGNEEYLSPGKITFEYKE